MTNNEMFKYTLRVTDTNLQFFETLDDLIKKTDNYGLQYIEVTPELKNMIEFIHELNFQQFRITNEKLLQNDVL